MMIRNLSLRLTIVGLALLGTVTKSHAQKSTYPKVSVATGYVVDKSWPQKPDDVEWGHMPGIAVDKNDHVYIFTRAQPPIQVYDSKGKFLRSWGEKTIETAHHIKIDHEGNIWLADIGDHTVKKFTPEGKLLLTIGTRGFSGESKTHLNKPTDMAITPEGDIFISDGYGNARVVHYDKTGKYINEWGSLGSKPGQFSLPHAICYCQGKLYVADRNNVRVQVFDREGKLLDVWDNLITPWGFWVTPDDEIWICGSSPMRWRDSDEALGCPPKDQVLMKFNPDGKLLQLWTIPKGRDEAEQPGEVNWIHCIAEDSQGNLYVGDIIGERAQKFVLVK